ncbi:MAG TPA: hypothetical protein VH092_07420 [Urbifossiella sp.]|nr:hypothetical protein [Urbifossiella sp.]
MVASIGFNSSTLTLSSLQQTTLSSAGSATDGTGSSSSTGDSSQLSGPAKLFSELKELASSDPTKFKQVASDIASKLKDAAGESSTDGTSSTSGSGSGNSPLADLAAKFQQAADTGDVSVLQPSGGGHGHGHAHGAGHYNQQGQVTPSPDSSSSGGQTMQSLFESISQEVTAALGS